MQPMVMVNPTAIVVSVVVSFVIGAIWYGPLFGKTWASAMGMPAQPSGAEIARGSLFNIIGLFLMAYVLAHGVGVWRPSTWGVGTDQQAWVYGFYGALFVWLGYVMPILLNSVAFERKSWTAFGIQVGYQFISLQAMGMILSHWR
jgi:hypothetical protein